KRESGNLAKANSGQTRMSAPPFPGRSAMAEMSSVPASGTAAPKFELPSSSGQTISLEDFKAKKIVVLYFYPRADTPGCTKEACGFRDALADYEKARVAVLGISPDPLKAVAKFGQKFHLNFPLLADEDHAVAERYGVW